MPAIEVPAGWAANAASGAGAPGLAPRSLSAWWQQIDDPLTADLVGRALLSNTSVIIAQAALRQARALRDLAAAGLLPTLGVSASAQRGTAGGDSTGSQFQAGLDAQWLPDVFGARRSALAAGDALAGASAASLGDARVQVAAEVALNVIVWRSTQSRWRIASANLVSQQETLQITDWRQQAGLVTVLEVEQARAAAAQTQALMPALQTSILQSTHALAVLVGQAPAALQVELASAPFQAMARTADAVADTTDDQALSGPADTLRQRADVRAAEFQVAAARANLGQAQAQRWPSFSIDGSIGLSAVRLATLTSGASVLGSLAAGVSLPLFDGGASQAQVRAQQAALELAQQTYRATVLGALKEVEDALVALGDDRLRLTSLRAAADSAGSASALARQRYSSGLVDFQTVLETQRNQLATEDGVVSARADVGRDQVLLFTALGGGWVGASELSGDQAQAARP